MVVCISDGVFEAFALAGFGFGSGFRFVRVRENRQVPRRCYCVEKSAPLVGVATEGKGGVRCKRAKLFAVVVVWETRRQCVGITLGSRQVNVWE